MPETNAYYMKLAVEESNKCPPDREEIHPKVGAIIVTGDEVIKAYRGENQKGSHAEFLVFRKAREKGVDLKGATILFFRWLYDGERGGVLQAA